MKVRRLGAALAVAAVMLTAAGTAQAGATGGIRRVAEPVKGSYIVALRAPVGIDRAPSIARAYGARIARTYRHAFHGFAAQMTEARALALSRDPRVASVEEDGVVRAVTTQSNATWGLDRIDQRDLPLNGTYAYQADGTSVTAYVIDTGIRITHAEFGGRAAYGTDTIDKDSTADDCNGHGTHVAGTIGGAAYGAAKAVRLLAVRVLDCNGSGTTSTVIAGIDWVTAHHGTGPAVANMSLGGGASDSLDTAVRTSIADGISYAVAAGNGNMAGIAQDACKYSPARVAEALTVSATDSADKKASWANYGPCVDLFAPGVKITSAWKSSDTSTDTISGTSMAAPHVAGAAALYLQGNPGASPEQVAAAINDNATTGKVSSAGSGSPNRLLYTGSGGNTDTPPTAAFTYNCSERTCSFDGGGSSDDLGIASYSWNLGDGSPAKSGATIEHTYAADGTYTVTLTVTDGANQSDDEQKQVSVAASTGGGSGITLTVHAYKVKGVHHADLSWTTDGTGDVYVKRTGTTDRTTADDGAFTDNIGSKGGGSYTYQVCETDSGDCSNEATATF